MMNDLPAKRYQDCTVLIRQFVSCACGKYSLTKHRGICCEVCDTEVAHRNYDFVFFLKRWMRYWWFKIQSYLKQI